MSAASVIRSHESCLTMYTITPRSFVLAATGGEVDEAGRWWIFARHGAVQSDPPGSDDGTKTDCDT